MKIFESECFMRFNFSMSLRRILSTPDNKFHAALLEEEILWISQFLSGIHEHLSNRVSQGYKLGQKDLIKYQVAEVESNIQLLQCAQKNLNEVSWEFISDLIRGICLALAKLAGGRALLRESVIEMLWTFELVNQIYWVGNYE